MSPSLAREHEIALVAAIEAVAELGRQRRRLRHETLAWLQDLQIVLAEAESVLVRVRDDLLDAIEMLDPDDHRDDTP